LEEMGASPLKDVSRGFEEVADRREKPAFGDQPSDPTELSRGHAQKEKGGVRWENRPGDFVRFVAVVIID